MRAIYPENDMLVTFAGVEDLADGSFVNDLDLRMTIGELSTDDEDDPIVREGEVTAVTSVEPVTLFSAGHGLANGDRVVVHSVGGVGRSRGTHTVANRTDDTFELSGVNHAGATYEGGGRWHRVVDGADEVPIVFEAGSSGDYAGKLDGTASLVVDRPYFAVFYDVGLYAYRLLITAECYAELNQR
ncbi:MAG: hypothetical protein AAF532_02250 [Planctomycetota bacterium]